jgi:hypothetical protein
MFARRPPPPAAACAAVRGRGSAAECRARSDSCAVRLLPIVLAQARSDPIQLAGIIDERQTELCLLTHKESRHLRRIARYSVMLSEPRCAEWWSKSGSCDHARTR